jgi:xanthine dehydrogenase YagR molybdenum-binding subunit
MIDHRWPAAADRRLLGKRISRLDGPAKSSGRAKYTYDLKRPGMLYGAMVLSPHPHARITAIDTSAAEAAPGVRAVQVIVPAGQTVRWVGQEVAAVAADTELQARDAARLVRVTWEPLPFLSSDVTPEEAARHAAPGEERARALAEQVDGAPDDAFADSAAVIHEGYYGSTVITHCCLEAHGQICEWEGDQLTVWASTQNVSGLAPQFAAGLGIPAANIRIICQNMGGGFGSKFQADTWGVACAQLARKAGKPVKMMLERRHELLGAGGRPSMYGRVKVAATRDGNLTAWSSTTWGTGGPNPAGAVNLPYVFRGGADGIPNRRSQHNAVMTNQGPARAWRAPNHPQMCVITMCAMDDLAAKLGMNPLDFFIKNISKTGPLAETYRHELLRAAELIGWSRKWRPRPKTPPVSGVHRGLGLSIHTWGGAGHNSNCEVAIHPDGSVHVSLGSQDLGTGTRTVIGIVAAETLGLPLEGVQVNIGDSRYPPSGPSGGSTTVGGVSASTRRASVNALRELFTRVAPALEAQPDELEAVEGRIRVKGNPAKSLTWKQACARLGTQPLTARGQRENPDDLISGGVGGAQMAEVSVDVETGVVRMENFVAVQDIGLIVDMKTTESQMYGAMIMGVTYALYEERVMDAATGEGLNAEMEFYKLAGIGDLGTFKVEMVTGPEQDARGVIGLGEPPVVSPGAAISNAVANAIGVRVPVLPLSPDRVLAALEDARQKGGA